MFCDAMTHPELDRYGISHNMFSHQHQLECFLASSAPAPDGNPFLLGTRVSFDGRQLSIQLLQRNKDEKNIRCKYDILSENNVSALLWDRLSRYQMVHSNSVRHAKETATFSD